MIRTRNKEQGRLGMVVGSIDMPWHWFFKPDFENNIFRKRESMPQSSDYRIPFLLMGRNLSFLITSDISCFQVHDTRPPLANVAQHADYALASW